MAIWPPGFNDWEQPWHTQTRGGDAGLPEKGGWSNGKVPAGLPERDDRR